MYKGGIYIFLSKSRKRTLIYYFLKLIIFLFLIILLIVFVTKKNNSTPILNLSNIQNTEILTEESLIDEVRNVNKLIPLEIDLNQTLTIEENLADLDIFHKSQKITFFAKCSYTLDFSKLNDKDIIIDDKTKTIAIKIDKPTSFNIDIIEDKTKYYEPELGLLRFTDIKLTSEDYGLIYKKLNDCFSSKMESEDLYSKCLSNSETILKDLLLNLTKKSYNINISFKNNN